MTVHESAHALRPDRDIVTIVDYDEYTDDPRCPLCASVLERVGTPTVDSTVLEVVVDLPVYAWQCDCRRNLVVVLATIDHAPEAFEAVEATVDGQTVDVGVPAPALKGVGHVA